MNATRRSFLNTAGSALALGVLGVVRMPNTAASPATIPSPNDLCFTSARDLAQLIRSRQISAREVMTAHLRQIAKLNPKLNAIVAKLGDDQCLALAESADRKQARGEALGALHGNTGSDLPQRRDGRIENAEKTGVGDDLRLEI